MRIRGLRGVHLGTAGGPVSLLLLPKCPLCLMPLLASLGIVMVPSARLLYLTAGVLIASWLGVVLFLGRRQPLMQLTAVTLAIAGGVAVAAHNTMLLWAAALSMVAVGAALRACTAKCSNLDMTTRRA